MGWNIQNESYLKLVASFKIFPSDFISLLLSEFFNRKSHFQCFFSFHIKKYQDSAISFLMISTFRKKKTHWILQDLQLYRNRLWHWRTFTVCWLSFIGLIKNGMTNILLESHNKTHAAPPLLALDQAATLHNLVQLVRESSFQIPLGRGSVVSGHWIYSHWNGGKMARRGWSLSSSSTPIPANVLGDGRRSRHRREMSLYVWSLLQSCDWAFSFGCYYLTLIYVCIKISSSFFFLLIRIIDLVYCYTFHRAFSFYWHCTICTKAKFSPFRELKGSNLLHDKSNIIICKPHLLCNVFLFPVH